MLTLRTPHLLTEVDEFTAAFDVPLLVSEVHRVRAAQHPTGRDS